MSLTPADYAERVLALPPASFAVAAIGGYPLSDISAGIMIIYGLMLIAWQLKTKWFAKRPSVGERDEP